MSPDPILPTFAADLSHGAATAMLRRAFAAAGLDTPALDARVLAADALGIAPATILSHPDAPLGASAASRLAEHARKRLAREPVARIVGEAEFWGLPFSLSAETLVPRPDTETLVEAALALMPDREAPARILDLGTGSGCILAALLTERPWALGLAVDRSPGALARARRNFAALGVSERAFVAASDWGAALAGPFDLVVSNPPYIPDAEIDRLDPEVARHDPRLALSGGPDGLSAIRAVLAAAAALLRPGGHGVIEFGHDQAESVGGLAQAAGLLPGRLVRDLGGQTRVIVVTRPAADLRTCPDGLCGEQEKTTC